MSSDRIMAEEPIEKKITRILIHRKMTVTAAESCTGGLVAGTLVNAATRPPVQDSAAVTVIFL